MATPVFHCRLTPTESAWLAGLVDGDGSITLSRRHRNEHRQLEVSISNTDFGLLDAVKRSVGTGRIIRKRIVTTRHTPSGVYIVSNRRALGLLEQLVPYLRTYKRERAALVLAHYVRLTPRNGYYTPELLRERKAFVRRFLRLNPRYLHFSYDSSDDSGN